MQNSTDSFKMLDNVIHYNKRQVSLHKHST